MLFHSWLQTLRSIVAPRRGQRHHGRHGSPRAGTRRPTLEVLQDRCLPSFSPITSFPTGQMPQAVATADFNNDGKLDLATADYFDANVLLGDGRGDFGTAQEFATGWWELSSIAVAHLNLCCAVGSEQIVYSIAKTRRFLSFG